MTFEDALSRRQAGYLLQQIEKGALVQRGDLWKLH